MITGGDEVCILPPPTLSEKRVGIPTPVHYPKKNEWDADTRREPINFIKTDAWLINGIIRIHTRAQQVNDRL